MDLHVRDYYIHLTAVGWLLHATATALVVVAGLTVARRLLRRP